MEEVVETIQKGIMKAQELCQHDFLDDPQNGEAVCTVCGQVGEKVLTSFEEPGAPPPTPGAVLQNELAVRNELYEAISRMSGGDVAGIHVEQAMSLLARLASDASTLETHTRDAIRRIGPRDGLEKGILAVVLHRALEENGRSEDIDLVAQSCGAARSDLLHAEKILEMGRGYVHNASVRMSIVLNTIQLRSLPASWLRVICTTLAMASEEAFCDLDTLVCAVAVRLARAIRDAVRMIPRANQKFVNRSGMAQHLSTMTVNRMAKLYSVSAGSVRRALKGLSPSIRDVMLDKACHLVMFLTPEEAEQRRIRAAFAAGKRKMRESIAAADKQAEFKENEGKAKEEEEVSWD